MGAVAYVVLAAAVASGELPAAVASGELPAAVAYAVLAVVVACAEQRARCLALVSALGPSFSHLPHGGLGHSPVSAIPFKLLRRSPTLE